MCKKVVKAILYNKFKVADSISRYIYNDAAIVNLGKMEVFENGV